MSDLTAAEWLRVKQKETGTEFSILRATHDFAPDNYEVLDKPATTDVRNTWGIAVWSPAFTSLLARELESARDIVLGAVFQRAVERGLRVHAVVFDAGEFIDVGTPQGLAAALVPRP